MKTIITFEIKGTPGITGKYRAVLNPQRVPGLMAPITMLHEVLTPDALGVASFQYSRPGLDGLGHAVLGLFVERLIGKSFEEREGCRYADLGVIEVPAS